MSGILYTIGWLWLVWGGASGSTFWPLCFSFGAVAFQLFRESEAKYYLDLFTLIYISMMGLILESVLVRTGLIHYAGTASVPLWILLLYPLFGMTLNHTLSFLKRSMVLSAVLGGVGGIASYRAGESLGAITISSPLAWVILGAVWACLIPFMVWILSKMEPLIRAVYEEQSPVQMLYDGNCPLCSREVVLLKRRNEGGLVAFVDISKMTSYQGISKDEMMREMLVLDAAGHLYRGVDAFFVLYGRLGLVFLALYLKAPLFYPLNQLAYQLFAKFRPFLNLHKE